VGIDPAQGAIPGQPHITLSRQPRADDVPRLALADSGLLDELYRAFPLYAVEKPTLRIVKPEAEPRKAGQKKVAGTRRRRSKPVESDDEPDGAA
jgi:hypothetical protein